MKIQIMSDLHWERIQNKHDIPDIEKTNADVIILAGDIHSGTYGIEWAAGQQSLLGIPIIYIAGNHEFYGHDYYEMNSELKKFAKKYNIHFLQNDSVIIDGVRFLGTTLWTNFGNGHPGLFSIAQNNLNDYKHIKADKWWNTKRGDKIGCNWVLNLINPDKYYRNFLPQTAYCEHKKSIRWLTKQLQKPFDGKTVVASHHAPSFESIKPFYQDHVVFNKEHWEPNFSDRMGIYRIAAYASDLTNMLSKYSDVIDLWAHGHTHCRLDYAEKGVHIVANPRGYIHRPLPDLFFSDLPEKGSPADPTKGDVYDFEIDYCVDLNDGLKPALLPKTNKLIKKLNVIFMQTEELHPYINDHDKGIADLAAYRSANLATSFNKITHEILLNILSNLNPQKEYDPDESLLYANQRLASNYYPKLYMQVDENYTPSLSKSIPNYNQKHYFDMVIRKMKEVETYLPGWIIKSLSNN